MFKYNCLEKKKKRPRKSLRYGRGFVTADVVIIEVHCNAMMVYAYIYSKCTSFFLQNAHLYSKSSTKIKPNSTFVNKINIDLVVDVVSELPSLTHAQLSEPSIKLTALPVPYTTDYTFMHNSQHTHNISMPHYSPSFMSSSQSESCKW